MRKWGRKQFLTTLRDERPFQPDSTVVQLDWAGPLQSQVLPLDWTWQGHGEEAWRNTWYTYIAEPQENRNQNLRNAVHFSRYCLLLSTPNPQSTTYITMHLPLGGIHQLISFHTTFHRSTQVFAECQRDTRWWICEAWWLIGVHIFGTIGEFGPSWLSLLILVNGDLFFRKTTGANWL